MTSSIKELLHKKFVSREKHGDNPTFSVKPGSPIVPRTKKIKTYISRLHYTFKLKSLKHLDDFGVRAKVFAAFTLAINVFCTGIVIWYSFSRRNFLSYGLMSALFMYYFKFVVTEIKKPYGEKEKDGTANKRILLR